MAKNKTFADKFARATPEELSKLTTEQMADYLKKAQQAFKTRVRSFARTDTTSFAAMTYYDADAEETNRRIRQNEFLFGDYSNIADERKRRNKMFQELARLQDFFQARTSNRQGIEAVNREQDLRIFGKGKFGKPRYTLTEQERKDYWSVYREYKNQNLEDFPGGGQSEKIQMMLGEIWTRTDFTPTDLAQAVSMLKKKYSGTLEDEPIKKTPSNKKLPPRFANKGGKHGVQRGRGYRTRR